MNKYDYIKYEYVEALSDEEFTAFRNYLKLIGNRVADGLGTKDSTFHDCVLYLNGNGNLSWINKCRTPYIRLKTGLSLEEVKRMASLGMTYE